MRACGLVNLHCGDKKSIHEINNNNPIHNTVHWVTAYLGNLPITCSMTECSASCNRTKILGNARHDRCCYGCGRSVVSCTARCRQRQTLTLRLFVPASISAVSRDDNNPDDNNPDDNDSTAVWVDFPFCGAVSCCHEICDQALDAEVTATYFPACGQCGWNSPEFRKTQTVRHWNTIHIDCSRCGTDMQPIIRGTPVVVERTIVLTKKATC